MLYLEILGTMTNCLPILETTQPWFEKGLRFHCTECGKCCTGAPGYVWVTHEEIQSIAAHLNMQPDAFIKKYIRKVGDRFSLIENRKDFSCPFLKEKRCTIYPVRPKQCKTFPWWLENIRSEQAWKDAASFCEGINHPDGKVYSSKEVMHELSVSPL